MPASAEDWAMSAKKSPNRAPAARANPTRRAVTRLDPPLGPTLTSAMATTARAAPVRASVPGVRSSSSPTPIGIRTAVTAVIGAATAMAPPARAR
jgi:hypothetical protein